MSELRILKAAAKGDLETLRQLVAEGFDINEQLPLLDEKELKTAKRFIAEAGLDLAAEALSDRLDITPLMAAIENDHQACVEFLLASGVEIERCDSLKRNAQMVAIQWKQEAIALKLLAAGSDPNAKDLDGAPVLTQAIEQNLWKIANALLDAGAKPHPRLKKDYVPLTAVAGRSGAGASALLGRLLDAGAKPNDNSILVQVIERHSEELLERILKDFPKFVKDAHPDQLIEVAAKRRKAAVLRKLQAAGVRARNSDDHASGMCALIIGPARSFLDFHKPEHLDDEREIECLEILLEMGCDIDHGGYLTSAPLHSSVGFYRLGLTQWLLSHGANVNATDRNNQTPLDDAHINLEQMGSYTLDEPEELNKQAQMSQLRKIIALLESKDGIRNKLKEDDEAMQANVDDEEDSPVEVGRITDVPVANRRGLSETGFSKVHQILLKDKIDAIADVIESEDQVERVERDVYAIISEVKPHIGHVVALVKLKGHDWVYYAAGRRWENDEALIGWSKQLSGPVLRAGEESVSGVLHYALYQNGQQLESFESDGMRFLGSHDIDRDDEPEEEDDCQIGTSFTSSLRDPEAVAWEDYDSEWEFVDRFFKDQDAYLTFMWSVFPGKGKPFEVGGYQPDDVTPESVERMDLIFYKPTDSQLQAAWQPDPAGEKLMAAIKANDIEAAKEVLATGLDLNVLPKSNNSYLTHAIGQVRMGKGTEMLDLLIEAGADPSMNGKRPVLAHLVPKLFASPETMKLIIHLIEAGSDVNAIDQGKKGNPFMPDRQSALLVAAGTCALRYVQLLLKHGADPSHADSTGKNALEYAERWHREVRKDLLNEQPSFALKGDDETARECVELLESAVNGTLDPASLPSHAELLEAEVKRKQREDKVGTG